MTARKRPKAALRFCVTDAGRSKSRRPKETNDCTIRALAVLMAVPYDVAYDAFKAAGRKWGTGFDLEEWLRHGAVELWDRLSRAGFSHHFLAKCSLNSLKGLPRVTIGDLIGTCAKGRWLVSVGRHVFCIIDGVIYDDGKDSRQFPSRCVYQIWQVKELAEGETLWFAKLLRGKGRWSKSLGLVPGRTAWDAYREASRLWEYMAIEPGADIFLIPIADLDRGNA